MTQERRTTELNFIAKLSFTVAVVLCTPPAAQTEIYGDLLEVILTEAITSATAGDWYGSTSIRILQGVSQRAI